MDAREETFARRTKLVLDCLRAVRLEEGEDGATYKQVKEDLKEFCDSDVHLGLDLPVSGGNASGRGAVKWKAVVGESIDDEDCADMPGLLEMSSSDSEED